MNLPAVSSADLASKLQEVMAQVHQGQAVMVQDEGHERAVLVDALDYRLLRAAADWTGHRTDPSAPESNILARYLDNQISLGKAAELLGLSRFDLIERFQRLGIDLHFGPATLAEAQAEVDALDEHNAATERS